MLSRCDNNPHHICINIKILDWNLKDERQDKKSQHAKIILQIIKKKTFQLLEDQFVVQWWEETKTWGKEMPR